MSLRLSTRFLRQRRNRITVLLLGTALLLAVLLLSGVRESDFFRVSVSRTRPDSNPSGMVAPVSGTQVQATLTQAAYSGLDADGRQWQVVAARAEQLGSVSSTGAVSGTDISPESAVVLHQVQANYTDPSASTPFTLAADQGTFYQTTNQLNLRGNVRLTGENLDVEAPMLITQIASRTAVGDQGAVVTSTDPDQPMRLSGNHLQVDEAAGRVTLTGNVRAVFGSR